MRDQALARFATAALEELTERKFIRQELVHDLLSARLNEHSGFYGEMVWVLMMLEHWLKRHAPSIQARLKSRRRREEATFMGIRDIVLFLVVAIGIPFILRNPAVGIGYWVWLSLMNPHREAWGFAYSFPFAFVVAVTTVIGLFLTKEPRQLQGRRGRLGIARLRHVDVFYNAIRT